MVFSLLTEKTFDFFTVLEFNLKKQTKRSYAVNFMILKIAELILDENIHLNLDELVSHYHQLKSKLKYKYLCRIITQQHGIPLSLRWLAQMCRKKIPLSLRWLKQMCRKKKIDRKRNVSNNELRESLIKVGRRQMTKYL